MWSAFLLTVFLQQMILSGETQLQANAAMSFLDSFIGT